MNAFIVSSPLQLINALEARRHYGIAERDSALVLVPIQYRDGDGEKLTNMAARTSWGLLFEASRRAQDPAHLTTFVDRTLAFRRFAVELRSIARQLGTVDRLFLGHYGDKWRRHLAHVLPHRTAHVLDDGFATLSACALRRSVCGRRPYERRIEESGIGRTALEYVLGARFADLDQVNFFTAYNIDPPSCDTIVENTYEYLRSQAGAKTVDEAAIMLGSPLVENGLLDEDDYADVIRTIMEDGGGRSLAYYPHRAERPERVRRLAERLGLVLKAPTLPFEWVLVTAPSLPAYLAGFHSSALYNCRLIFGDYLDIRAYRPAYAPKHLTGARWKAMENVYAYFESHAGDRFRVVDLSTNDAVYRARA